MLKQFTIHNNYNSPIISLCSHSGTPSKQCARIKAPTQKRTHLELHHRCSTWRERSQYPISQSSITGTDLNKKNITQKSLIHPSFRQFISVWANNVRRNSFVFRATAIASSLFHLCCTCVCECGHNAYGQTPSLIMFHLRLLLQLCLLLIAPMTDWLTDCYLTGCVIR